MKIIHRALYQESILTVFWMTLGFICIFSFFNALDDIHYFGQPSLLNPQQSFGIKTLAMLSILEIPLLTYDLIPICVLMGCIFVMSRLANQSEFTVMRSGGFSPLRAVQIMICLGIGFAVFTFAIGDYIAPYADKHKTLIKSAFDHRVHNTGMTGGWLKEKKVLQEGHTTLNFGELLQNGDIADIRLFQFDAKGQLQQYIEAQSGRLQGDYFSLREVTLVKYPEASALEPLIQKESAPKLLVPTTIEPEMISATMLSKQKMNTWHLWRVIQYLKANNQNSQRQEIEFWSKIFYPLSCLVMALMALPFAYSHSRKKGTSFYLFMGVMLGISFFLLNNMFIYLGNLQNWIPWLSSAAPSLFYMSFSLFVTTWLVIKR